MHIYIHTYIYLYASIAFKVMGEVSLEARAPKPEDELEARLARLRGEEPRPLQPQGAVALPPHCYQNSSHGGAETFSEDLEVITMDEVGDL